MMTRTPTRSIRRGGLSLIEMTIFILTGSEQCLTIAIAPEQ